MREISSQLDTLCRGHGLWAFPAGLLRAANAMSNDRARDQTNRRVMTMWSVSALGIGSMVGAGIFALFGQAALVAGKDVYLSFLIGGTAALLSGYSYAKLAARYPAASGILEYFNRAFPSRLASGALSLIYLLTLVVTITMVAKTFGAYASRLFFAEDALPMISGAFASGIVVVLVIVNMIGANVVSRAEVTLVAIKLLILVLLMLAGLPSMDPKMFTSGISVAPTTLLASVGLTFFAYAGYGMMANAAADVRQPETTVPRAMFLAIGVVIVLYVGLAIVILGNIPADELSRYADTAVAQAARPLLGHSGFVIVSIGALLASASAINATIFSALAISKGLAEQAQLPRLFADAVWHDGTKGLLWTTAAILLAVNLLDLAAVANTASVTFLIVYLAIFGAHWRLRRDAGGSPIVIICGLSLMGIVLVVFLFSLFERQPIAIVFMLVFVTGSASVVWLMKRKSTGATS